jgi:hypothetical protein
MKKVDLYISILFRGSIPFSSLAYGLASPSLPLHTPDYSDAWEVLYHPAG